VSDDGSISNLFKDEQKSVPRSSTHGALAFYQFDETPNRKIFIKQAS